MSSEFDFKCPMCKIVLIEGVHDTSNSTFKRTCPSCALTYITTDDYRHVLLDIIGRSSIKYNEKMENLRNLCSPPNNLERISLVSYLDEAAQALGEPSPYRHRFSYWIDGNQNFVENRSDTLTINRKETIDLLHHTLKLMESQESNILTGKGNLHDKA